MNDQLPLSTLLSLAVVAFTIEADNEFEQSMPHRTTRGPAAGRGGPWLTSFAMWANFLQYVGDEGITPRALEAAAHVAKLPLDGMRRWGYVTITPDPADPRPKPPLSAWIIRATNAGRRAQTLWPPILAEVEQRWRTRFGDSVINHVRRRLASLLTGIDVPRPAFLPVLGYGLRADLPRRSVVPPEPIPDAALITLLAQVLERFTREFEREFPISLAVCANFLRVADGEGVALADLPRRTGIAKETVAVAIGWLARHDYATLDAAPSGSRGKWLRLNAEGCDAREAYLERVAAIEAGWSASFGDAVPALRESLEPIVGDGTAGSPG